MSAPTGYISIEEHQKLIELVRAQARGSGMVEWDDLIKKDDPKETAKGLAQRLLDLVRAMNSADIPPWVLEALAFVIGRL